MKILKPLIASVMASVSLVGLAQSDFSQVGLAQPGYKYEKPAGADNFYHTYNASEQQVSFLNQYKMKVAGTLFIPYSIKEGEKLPAIIVGHPMGAVKEQSAMLYARKMADAGFVTLAIDLPFWGQSEGEPRNAVSPDLYAEAFSAAVDYLSEFFHKKYLKLAS